MRTDRRTEIQTDTNDEANSRFSPFCKRVAPKKNAVHAVYFRRSARNLRRQPISGPPSARTDTHEKRSRRLHIPSKLPPFTVTHFQSLYKNYTKH
jgi:hypothetical protein